MGLVTSVSNQKGGVGKTTTAINLSASLAVAGRPCLLVDCDPQGNATTGVGVNRRSLARGVYDLLMGLAAPTAAITETVVPKLHLIGSTPSLIGAEVELNSMEGKEYRLQRALSGLRDAYDHVFLDCPPSLGFLTVNALTAADAVLVPLQCEYYALEGLSELIRTLKAVKGSLNPSLRLAGLVLTMYDNRNNLSQQVAEELRSHFGASVFETVIPRNVRLSEAPSHGKPVLMYDMQCKGAQSYLALARELIYRGAGKNGKTKGTGEGVVSADSGGTGI